MVPTKPRAAKKKVKPALKGRPDVNVFIAEYKIDRNGRRAAIAAGYAPNSAAVTASRLLKKLGGPGAIGVIAKRRVPAVSQMEAIYFRKLGALKKLVLHLSPREGAPEQAAPYLGFALSILLSDASPLQKSAALALVDSFSPALRKLLPLEVVGEAVERRDPLVRVWRNAVLRRDGSACKGCGSLRQLEAHHINRWVDAPHLRLVVANGLTLCKECHDKEHGKAA